MSFQVYDPSGKLVGSVEDILDARGLMRGHGIGCIVKRDGRVLMREVPFTMSALFGREVDCGGSPDAGRDVMRTQLGVSINEATHTCFAGRCR
jgi:hypothetical protein